MWQRRARCCRSSRSERATRARPRATTTRRRSTSKKTTVSVASKGPIAFEVTGAKQGFALPLPPVTARITTVEALTSPSFAPLSGRVIESQVHLGDHVKKGQQLVLVRTADLPALERDVRSAELAVTTKGASVERMRALVESRAGSQNDLLLAQSELDESKLSLQAAKAKLNSLQIERSKDETAYWVLANRSGTVVQLDAAPARWSARSAPRRWSPSPTWPRCWWWPTCPSATPSSCRRGAIAHVFPSGAAGESVPGTIEVVSDVVDPERQTVPVRVRVDNSARKLRPNAYVDLSFEAAHRASRGARAQRRGGARRRRRRGVRGDRDGLLRAARGRGRPPHARRGRGGQRRRQRASAWSPPARSCSSTRSTLEHELVIEAFVSAALRNRAAVIAMALLTLVLGYFAFREVSIEAFPDPTDTQVNVITLQSRASPPRRWSVRSRSPSSARSTARPGLSRVRAHQPLRSLVHHAHLPRRRRRASSRARRPLERLRLVELPEGVTPQLGSLSTPIGEIYRYTLTAPKRRPARAAHAAGLGGAAAPAARRRRRRRGQLRRPACARSRCDPIRSRWPPRGSRIADLERRARAALASTPRAASSSRASSSWSSAARACSTSLGDIERTAVATRGGTPIFVSRRRLGAARAGSRGRASSGAATTPTRSRASCSCGAARTRRACSSALRAKVAELNDARAAEGHAASRRLLRPHRARRHHAGARSGHNLLEGARARGAGAVRVPARPARGADRGAA